MADLNSYVNIGANTITTVGKIGYANGGAVTQTSSGQGVTLNQLTGKVTLAKSSWAANDIEFMIVNCNKVANDDFILAQCVGSTNSISFTVTAYPYTVTPNSIAVWVKALESVADTPIVQFFIMKAPTS